MREGCLSPRPFFNGDKLVWDVTIGGWVAGVGTGATNKIPGRKELKDMTKI